MSNFYETQFADAQTVVVESGDKDEFMTYMVRFYRERMAAGDSEVTVRSVTADGRVIVTDEFKVSKEGFALYARLVDMDKE